MVLATGLVSALVKPREQSVKSINFGFWIIGFSVGCQVFCLQASLSKFKNLGRSRYLFQLFKPFA